MDLAAVEHPPQLYSYVTVGLPSARSVLVPFRRPPRTGARRVASSGFSTTRRAPDVKYHHNSLRYSTIR